MYSAVHLCYAKLGRSKVFIFKFICHFGVTTIQITNKNQTYFSRFVYAWGFIFNQHCNQVCNRVHQNMTDINVYKYQIFILICLLFYLIVYVDVLFSIYTYLQCIYYILISPKNNWSSYIVKFRLSTVFSTKF